MRILLFLSFIAAFNLSASVYSQNTRLDLKVDNITVKELLKVIESKSNIRFFYSDDIRNLNKTISFSAQNETVDKILSKVLSDGTVSYKVLDNNIVVITPFDFFQQQKIQGVVTDVTNGDPIIGANVIVEGTTLGTVTDVSGRFSLDIPSSSAAILISFLGYNTERIVVNDQTDFTVKLVPDIKSLEEVVVVGYGIQKKKLVTGATIQVKGEQLQKLSTVSPLTALQSQSPGLSIVKYSGKPGSDFKINVRGLGTIGNASPLIIIDGVVGGDLNMINPSDIESIDVLKDAASAAIYGARAANGVILLQTKKGVKGKNRISYDGYFGIQNVAKYLDVLDAKGYLTMQEEAYKNIGVPVPDWATIVRDYSRIQQGWGGTDWQKEFTNKNAVVQNHSVNLTGGNEISNYSLGLSYTGQEGIYGQPEAPLYQRYSFRLNSEHVIYKNSSFDVVKIGENLLYNYIEQDHSNLAADGIYNNDTRWIMNMHPLMPVYDANGNFTKSLNVVDLPNPIGVYANRRSNSETKNNVLRMNAYLEFQPFKGLVYRSSFGLQSSASTNRSYVPKFDLGGRNVETMDIVEQGLSTGKGYQFENTLNYKAIVNNHNLDVLVGMSLDKNGMGESMYGRNRGSIFNSFDYAYLNNVKTMNPSNVALNGSPWRENIITSYFGRINYDLKETYLMSLIMRADGSSNFAKGNRWGYFPSVSAGWIISNESFMETASKVVDYFKIRASWGQNGNQSIDPFQYLSIYSFSGGDYYFGPEKNSVDVGAYPRILPNKDVTWETSEQINIGFDSRFLNSRMGINFDWYKKTTKDWLVRAPVPAVWGAAAPFINGGDVENKGVEVVVTWSDKIGELKYSINANMALNKNEILHIANTEGIIEGAGEQLSTGDRTAIYRAQVGYPISYFYGYKTKGVFQSQAEIDSYTGAKLKDTKPGDLIYADVDQNDTIDTKDKTIIGDPNPDVIFGFSLNLEYKGFDFSLSANGVFGNQIVSSFRPGDAIYNNWPAEYLKRWHGEGTSNRYPRIDAKGHPNWSWNSDIYVEDGDFLRIQNITLGYDFKKLIPQLPFGQARFYISAQNLYTFTKYFGPDPEIGFAGDSWAKGIDIGSYPSPRTFLAGVNVKF